jgi:entericidin B
MFLAICLADSNVKLISLREVIMIKQKLILLLLSMFLISLSGCATVEGVGKDVESAGEAVQDAADGE